MTTQQPHTTQHIINHVQSVSRRRSCGRGCAGSGDDCFHVARRNIVGDASSLPSHRKVRAPAKYPTWPVGLCGARRFEPFPSRACAHIIMGAPSLGAKGGFAPQDGRCPAVVAQTGGRLGPCAGFLLVVMLGCCLQSHGTPVARSFRQDTWEC